MSTLGINVRPHSQLAIGDVGHEVAQYRHAISLSRRYDNLRFPQATTTGHEPLLPHATSYWQRAATAGVKPSFLGCPNRGADERAP